MLPKQMFNMWCLTMLVLLSSLQSVFGHHAFFSDSAGAPSSIPQMNIITYTAASSAAEKVQPEFSTHHRCYTMADDMPNSTTSRPKYEWIVYEVLEDDIWIVRLPRHFWFVVFWKAYTPDGCGRVSIEVDLLRSNAIMVLLHCGLLFHSNVGPCLIYMFFCRIRLVERMPH